MVQSEIRVFDYTDYRRFLHDYYVVQKRRNRFFSYRYFSRKAGINSTGLYKDVVDGRQSLGRGLVVKFSKAMGLGRKEAAYFENMVFFNEAKSASERKFFFDRMIQFKDSEAHRLDGAQFEFYSRWYHSAVRALLSYSDLAEDFEAISRELEPAIKPAEARKALEVLARLGLIAKDASGKMRPVDPVITSGVVKDDAKAKAHYLVGFQRAMSELAMGAFDRFPTDRLDMSTLTLSISGETYRAMKEEIAALRRRLSSMAAHDGGADRVYQWNCQFFPLTRDRK